MAAVCLHFITSVPLKVVIQLFSYMLNVATIL